ncbi:MAG TPA: carboxylating nicotinate-nucleotide diphosphorylase, partial [Xanthomonadaceae bacterium]|nr:carboxylating nicotinate-nucleotide diphosphorylase [Xanthomonadaceae bacterium]
QQDVDAALAEDIGTGDATADLLPADLRMQAQLLCREHAVLAGRAWFDACFRELDVDIVVDWRFDDGDRIPAGSYVCSLKGKARALVAAERSALNFLQTLSGTATATARYCDAVAGSRLRILDTRKTLPGLRHAQKYAVRCGGGSNHRMGLYDAILVKENHIAAAGGIDAAVRLARVRFPDLPLEVEVESLHELDQALACGVPRVLLDEFSLDDMREAVRRSSGIAELEVSGGVELEGLADIAATGVDYVSIGALTKHVRAVDFSLRLRTLPQT